MFNMITTHGVRSHEARNLAAHNRGVLRGLYPLAGAILGGMSLIGCAGLGMGPMGTAPTAQGTAVAVPADPLLAFAATAAPGMESSVTLPQTGRPTRVRLLRAYNAASGHECREVLLGSGLEERSRLVCQADGTWREARPLLRSGTARP
ncbi:hypothetical protein GCM10011504_20300 [Siccirubricoccus deserti]|nr:hypothetical protein GCM10011504_20300 [Siccirubricoccus deserti]